jgi:bacterioferritin-associated ferredoxin
MELDDTVCHCFHITKRKVMNFIRVERPRVPSQIANCGGAGTGCGWCVAYLRRYFAESMRGELNRAESNRGRASVAETSGGFDRSALPVDASIENQAPEITAAEYAARRAGYIRAGKGKPAPGAIPLPPEG